MLPIWIVGGHAFKLSERNSLTSGTKRLFRIKRLLKTTVAAAGIGLIWMEITEPPLQVVKAALPEPDNSKSIAAGAETDSVRYQIDSPVNAHVDLFSRYTDDDIHNLMAYIQTLH